MLNLPQNKSPTKPNKHQKSTNHMMRWGLFLLGFVFLGLGILGVVLPGLPTTVFVLLAGYCWSRSSDRFHDYLLRHRVFGKVLSDWERHRAMPRFAKYLAWGMMMLSCVILAYRLPADWMWVVVLVGVICLAVSIWMAKLPDA
ncbi:YbaN family protein [Moraxella oculi]|uniref:Inner membrane protein n=1 Tax=Moraxella oculi TaxID=2940516 RepID=A0ABW8UAX9_9GAMM